MYTDHVGPEISVNLCIASPFSRQIAIDNAGPATTLESMGEKTFFHYRFVNIFTTTGESDYPFPPIGANGIWDQH